MTRAMGHSPNGPLRQLEELLNLKPIRLPEPIDFDIRMPTLRSTSPVIPPATPEDAIARKAAAAIEREDGFRGCADNRLRGAYDGDAEHRIALKAIELSRQLGKEGGK